MFLVSVGRAVKGNSPPNLKNAWSKHLLNRASAKQGQKMSYLQTIFNYILMNLIRFFRLPSTTHLERRKTLAMENISSKINCYRKKLSYKTRNYATTKTITRNIRETSMGPKLSNLARRSLKFSSIKPYPKHIENPHHEDCM